MNEGATIVPDALRTADPCHVLSLDLEGNLTPRVVNHCWAWKWTPGAPGQLGDWTTKKFCATCLVEREAIVGGGGVADATVA